MNNRSREIKRIKRLRLTNVVDFKIFDPSTGKFKPFRTTLFGGDITRTKNSRYYSEEALINIIRKGYPNSAIITAEQKKF